MKKILILLLTVISFSSKGQTINTRLDTVFERYRVFTYEEISYIEDNWAWRNDSLSKAFHKKLAVMVNAVPNKVNATNITVDSIPGPVAINWYTTFRNKREGETAGFTNNIKNQLKTYSALNSHCVYIDNQLDATRINSVKNGKDDW